MLQRGLGGTGDRHTLPACDEFAANLGRVHGGTASYRAVVPRAVTDPHHVHVMGQPHRARAFLIVAGRPKA